jgi:hypothetical protein
MDQINPYLGDSQNVESFQAYLKVAGAALRVFNSFYTTAQLELDKEVN